MMSAEEKRSKLALLASMLIFGTIGIFRRNIPMPSSILAMVRGLIGTVVLILFVFLKRDRLSWKNIKANLVYLVVSGVLIGFNWILLFESYQYTSVATATLCYYMAPIFVVLCSPLLLKERLTIKKVICVIVALGGMVLVSGIFEAGFSGTGEFKGVLFGLGAAVLYASVVLLNQKIQNVSAYEKTIMQLGSAAVVLLPYTSVTEDFSSLRFTVEIVVLLLFVGIVNTGIAYALYFSSMKDLNAQTVALFGYIDPVVAIILSAVILGERMNLLEITGAVLILCATLVSELPEKKSKYKDKK